MKRFVEGAARGQSSRRLEREAGRNFEVMWLLGRLVPDHKTVADFRKNKSVFRPAGVNDGSSIVDETRSFPAPVRNVRFWVLPSVRANLDPFETLLRMGYVTDFENRAPFR
jgi:hypothetical protein